MMTFAAAVSLALLSSGQVQTSEPVGAPQTVTPTAESQQAAERPDPVVCRAALRAASRLRARQERCLRQSEWDRIAQESRESTQSLRNHSASIQGGGQERTLQATPR